MSRPATAAAYALHVARHAQDASGLPGLEPWLLRARVLLLAAGAVALTILARHTLSLAAHPVDTKPGGYTIIAVMYALVAAMLLGPAAWAVLGGARRAGRWLAVAAPATALALLPWTAATNAGTAFNLAACVLAAVSWFVAVRASRGQRSAS
jgi:hypothetical protein